jgi:DNA end-binding protein Ku
VLKKSEKVAVAKIILHTKQHLCAILPRGRYLLLEILHFANEVKELRELDVWKGEVAPARISTKEVGMAERLVEEMSSKWEPDKYKDTYRDDLMKRINAKVKAGKATEITEAAPEEKEAPTSAVIDLMPLLKKSLSTGSHKPRGHAHHH